MRKIKKLIVILLILAIARAASAGECYQWTPIGKLSWDCNIRFDGCGVIQIDDKTWYSEPCVISEPKKQTGGRLLDKNPVIKLIITGLLIIALIISLWFEFRDYKKRRGDKK